MTRNSVSSVIFFLLRVLSETHLKSCLLFHSNARRNKGDAQVIISDEASGVSPPVSARHALFLHLPASASPCTLIGLCPCALPASALLPLPTSPRCDLACHFQHPTVSYEGSTQFAEERGLLVQAFIMAATALVKKIEDELIDQEVCL
jgi:hypothetical protein